MVDVDPIIILQALLNRQYAPADAQKNSDITREEIEAKLGLDDNWGKFVKVNGSGNGLEYVDVEPGAAYDGDPTVIVQDADHRFVTDAQINDWDGKADSGHDHTGVYEPVKGADDNYVTDEEKVKIEAIDQVFTSTEKTKLGHISVSQAVDLDDIETRVNNLDAAVVLKGTWDASAGTFPGGGTAQAGASYIVSVAGTVDGVSFNQNDRIIAITDNASTATYTNNWFKADYTDQVLSVAGLTGAISAANLKTALDLSGSNSGDETGAGIRTKLGTTTVGAAINTLTNPSAISYLKINADNTVSARTQSQMQADLGGTTVGIALYSLTNPSAIRYLKINADNSVSTRTAAEMLTDLGATTVGGNILLLSNPSAVRFLRINADNTVTARTAAEMLSDIGAQASGSYLTSSNIVATITNGVTTNAPSEDAVFDALELKAQCNSAEFSQVVVSGTAYYITQSLINIKTTTMQVGSSYSWDITLTKTAAGTGTFQFRIYRGINGTTADTADVTQTIGTQTAVVDTLDVCITICVTATGATGSYFWTIAPMNKAASAAGFGVATGTTGVFSGTVSGVALNTANLKFGIAFIATTGTPTIRVAQIRKFS